MMIKQVPIYMICVLGFITVGCASRKIAAPIDNLTHVGNYSGVTTTVTSTNETPPTAVTPEVSNVTTSSLTAPSAIPVEVTHINQQTQTTTVTTNANWIMPSSGAIIQKFNLQNKGIDITSSIGSPILAVNDGKVVYSGNGLKGYGNLIIIKHSNDYLSAYAHNQSNLVHDGDRVRRGQQIATMGVQNGKPLLHLELRKNGSPIDPLSLIRQP